MIKKTMSPRLSVHLSRLRLLASTPDERPHFDSREAALRAADERSEETGEDYIVTPVWRIDHVKLEDSEPVAWSYSRNAV